MNGHREVRTRHLCSDDCPALCDGAVMSSCYCGSGWPCDKAEEVGLFTAHESRINQGQRADWSAMSITNSASTVLFSCSNEELALIMEWALAQAKAWQDARQANASKETD